MKKIMFVFVVLALILAPIVYAKPSTVIVTIELKASETLLRSGVSFINATLFSNSLDGKITSSNNSYTIACRNHSITIKPKSSLFTFDGKNGTFTSKQIPFIEKGKLKIPARKLTELFGGKVEGKTLVFSKTILKDIVFLHHSCGSNWIADGQIREKLTKAEFEFWDHGYNEEGLRNPKGDHTGTNYGVPGDNTNPDGYTNIFAQQRTNPPTNTLSHLLAHDVIIIKSCFPVSNIYSDEDLFVAKEHYKTVISNMAKYPDKTFIIVTQPPMNRKATTKENALRARKLANFLKSTDFLKSAPNVSTFDWFNMLAVSDQNSPYYSMLKPEYSPDGNDSHPNYTANFNTSPEFVKFVVSKATKY
ncbi:MAG: hypothetical protein KA140_08300 [Caldisericia bacterium]|nr:hypothetical protein [Caldisericia bacterium]